LRPVFWTAATKLRSSQEFIVERSIGVCLGKTAWICGHMLPEKPLVSTVESTTGTSNTRAALVSTRLLLMIVCRSWLATPKSICGCRSMTATRQLSGVSRPFSLSFGRLADGDMTDLPEKRKVTRTEVARRAPARPGTGRRVGTLLLSETLGQSGQPRRPRVPVRP
jgi:hypothetical protein